MLQVTTIVLSICKIDRLSPPSPPQIRFWSLTIMIIIINKVFELKVKKKFCVPENT